VSLLLAMVVCFVLVLILVAINLPSHAITAFGFQTLVMGKF
jgi:hypothetical protein